MVEEFAFAFASAEGGENFARSSFPAVSLLSHPRTPDEAHIYVLP